jgi:hypothetical protein
MLLESPAIRISPSPAIVRGDFRKCRRTRFDSCRAMRRYFPCRLKMKMSPENRGFRDSVIGDVELRGCDRDWRRLSKIVSASRCDCHRDVLSRVIAAESCACFAARQRNRFIDRFVWQSGRFCRSIRRKSRCKGGKPTGRVPTLRSAHQMELIENTFTEQCLAAKVQSRLRVICATPFQKRAVRHRSKRFLCCVCRCLR